MPNPLAGQPAPASILIDVAALERAYYERQPDPRRQPVSFGTSGHRGTSLDSTFTEAHILAITQAICVYRNEHDIHGPLYVGMDSHALSANAQRTALEVLAANDVNAVIQAGDGFTPTPVISHAILTYNATHGHKRADGVVITPSHNPPSDGGFKYNPPNGGPADTDVTRVIQKKANELLEGGNRQVKRLGQWKDKVSVRDLVTPYVEDLGAVVDMDAVRDSGIRLGVHPLGGASVGYWRPIAERYGLKLTVVDGTVDPQFGFMTVDHDGKIRMDCSSPDAMASLVGLRDQYRVAWGNDPDADRHGIVTPGAGLLNPNHYLAVAIRYLSKHRPGWPSYARIGKTLVSSGIIDRLCASLHRDVYEVPVGFKWFTPGLYDGSICFAGEESAGASFLRRNGKPWSTDKDGLILGLLAAEMTAVTGRDPGEHYAEIEAQFGQSFYARIDTPATKEEKDKLKSLRPEAVADAELAGSPITARLTQAPGNGAKIDGLKVVTAEGWFAARPSGTEDVYKLYAESFVSSGHLVALQSAARELVKRALAG